MRGILLIIFGLVATWDVFTTFVGISEILGDKGSAQIFIAVVFALVIAGFLFGTSYIFSSSGGASSILIVLWFIALGYDLYTSYAGNLYYVMEGSASGNQHIILIGLTLLVSCAPIIVSSIVEEG